MRKVISCMFYSYCLFQGSYAIAADPPPFSEAFKLLVLSDKQLSNSDRRTIAKGFNRQCSQINAKIPALSLSEKRWLNAEIKAGRLVALMSSVEAAKQTIKRVFTNCEEYASLIPDISSAIREAIIWAIVAREISTPYLLNRFVILNEKKIATLNRAELAVVSNFQDIAHSVLKRIIIPILSSAAKKGNRN